MDEANDLVKAGNSKAAIAFFDDLVARFADAPEPILRDLVARALFSKAITLQQMGDSAAEIATYDDIISRFMETPEPAWGALAAIALMNKAVAFSQMGDNTAAIASYGNVISRFADAPELTLRKYVAVALMSQADTFGRMGDDSAAIATYDDVISWFADAPEPTLRDQAAGAILLRGARLRDRGQIAAAVDAFEHLLARTLSDPQGFITFSPDEARIICANMLLDFQGDLVRAETLYREAESTEPLSAHANLAWLHVLAARPADARRELDESAALPAVGLTLLKAGIELASDNFGAATSHLALALDSELDAGGMTFGVDLDRLLRLAQNKGYGERLLAWFEQTGVADRLAPLYVAFKAYVRTERLLLDVNPEVRGPARIIYDRLDAPRRYAASRASQTPRPRRPRKADNRRQW
jgi:hypothetical protein